MLYISGYLAGGKALRGKKGYKIGMLDIEWRVCQLLAFRRLLAADYSINSYKDFSW
jgi:hypothetical protein